MSETITTDGKSLFPGDTLFDLKTTHGLPLGFALDKIINQDGMAIDWVGFIEAARRNNWWDFQTFQVICEGMEDADIPRPMRSEISDRLKLYIMQIQCSASIDSRSQARPAMLARSAASA